MKTVGLLTCGIAASILASVWGLGAAGVFLLASIINDLVWVAEIGRIEAHYQERLETEKTDEEEL